MTAPLQLVLAALEARGCKPRRTASGYSAKCPAHDDNNPSLTVAEGDHQPVVLNCQAGCTPKAVLEALGMTLADVCENSERARPNRRIVATYDYQDVDGKVLYQSVRYDPKDFRQRRPDGTWGIKGVRRVLYNLPAVVDVIERGGTIYVVEGEKDADAINQLDVDAIGYVATCNPMGAGKWRPEYTATLESAARVIVWADDDDAGKKHARQVADSLRGVVADVSVVVSPHAHDVADHLTAGHRLQDVVPLDGPSFVFDARLVLDPAAGQTRWFVEDFIPEASMVLVAAGWKTGKTFLLYRAAIDILNGGPVLGTFNVTRPDLRVLVWQAEMPTQENARRLRKLMLGAGLDPEQLVRWADEGRFRMLVQPPVSFSESHGLEAFHKEIDSFDPHIVIVDSAGEVGLSISSNEDVRRELRAVVNKLQVDGRALVMTTHKRKGQQGAKPDADRDAIIGAQSWAAKASRIYTVERVGDDNTPGDFAVKLIAQRGWNLTECAALYLRVYDAQDGTATHVDVLPLDEVESVATTKTDRARIALIELAEERLMGYRELIRAAVERGHAESTAKRAYRQAVQVGVLRLVDRKVRGPR